MMYRIIFLMVLLFLFTDICHSFAQSDQTVTAEETDSIPPQPVILSPSSASEYLVNLIGKENLWRDGEDTMKLSLTRLIGHFQEPFDSVRSRLSDFPFDAVALYPDFIVRHDTMPLRWLSDNEFIVDTLPLEKDPFIKQKTVVMRALDDTLRTPVDETPYNVQALIDSVLQIRDTIVDVYIDYNYLKSKNIQVYKVLTDSIVPPLLPPEPGQSLNMLPDSVNLLLTDTTHVIMGDKKSPFYIVPDTRMPDSLHSAVETLLSYTYERDSILVYFHDIEGQKTPFWLTGGEDELYRYWVRNAENDSITIWIGNPSKHDISLILEDDVFVERLEARPSDDIPITTARPERALAAVRPLDEIPVFWDYGLATSFSMNQNYLANWARGGESSLSGMVDINARARYRDQETGVRWTSSGRLRYGTTRTKEHGSRKSADIIELNSQYNKKLWEKVDFSSVFYMKTQVAKGFNYPNDSVAVSSFLNPGTFTLGVGMEFEPLKNTSINFSALSYRNTFVLDTVSINQTAHGVETGKRARQEMGGQMVIRNSLDLFDGLKISNSIRLFSNYLRKPQNVDVDWEMSLEQEINWYFTVRLNLHLIYDDNVRFPVLDDQGDPVLLPDGSVRKVAKTQFNQFLGLTLSLRL